MAAGIPALEEIRFIGVEDTVPEVAATFAPRKRGGPEIALHRAQTQPDLLRNGRGRPALAVQGPDLRHAAPAGVPGAAPRAAAPGSGRSGVARARRPSHRAAARAAGAPGIDGVEGLAMRGEHLVQGFPEILQQMKAVRDLGGCGAPWRAPSA